MIVVFVAAPGGLYDLQVDGRVREYDVDPEDFSAALKRTRLDLSRAKVFVEDATGYRTKLSAR